MYKHERNGDFKAGRIIDQFALSLHLCRCCTILYDAMIDEPCHDDIIKLILPIKILTTWGALVRRAKGQKRC